MRSRLLAAAALVALVFAVFAQVRGHAFVDYDDELYLAKARHGLSVAGVRAAFTEEVAANWVPLTVLTLLADFELHEREPAGYLLGNAVLHAAASVVLLFALMEMTGAFAPSLFVAAVFAVHPLHVESVAWLSQRKDVLCGLLWMCALWAHARWTLRPSAGRRAAVLVAGALALLAKPMAVTLPFTLILLDYWPLGRLRDADAGPLPQPARLLRSFREQAPLLALVAAIAAATFAIQQGADAVAAAETLPFDVRLANALTSTLAYLRSAFWPTGLAAFYPHPMSIGSGGGLALAAILLLGISGGVAALARVQPWLVVGWLWFLGTLVPVIGLVQVGMQARADRYTYVPLIGLALAVGFAGASVAGRLPRFRLLLGAAGCAAVAALAVAAHAQTAYWRDSLALFGRAVAVTEGNFFAERGLARALAEAGEPETALVHFGRAIELRPEWSKPRFELAALLVERGNRPAAIIHYRRGLDLEPGDLRARVNLGHALVADGRPVAARNELLRVEHAVAAGAPLPRRFRGSLEYGLGAAAAATARPGEAVRRFRAALVHQPGLAAATRDLAWLHATTDDPAFRNPDEAVRLAEALARRTGEGDPRILDTLAAAYAGQGRFDSAIAQAVRAEALARSQGRRTLATEIRGRLALYREGRAVGS